MKKKGLNVLSAVVIFAGIRLSVSPSFESFVVFYIPRPSAQE